MKKRGEQIANEFCRIGRQLASLRYMLKRGEQPQYRKSQADVLSETQGSDEKTEGGQNPSDVDASMEGETDFGENLKAETSTQNSDEQHEGAENKENTQKKVVKFELGSWDEKVSRPTSLSIPNPLTNITRSPPLSDPELNGLNGFEIHDEINEINESDNLQKPEDKAESIQ